MFEYVKVRILIPRTSQIYIERKQLFLDKIRQLLSMNGEARDSQDPRTPLVDKMGGTNYAFYEKMS